MLHRVKPRELTLKKALGLLGLAALLTLPMRSQQPAPPAKDISPHTVQFVPADKDVKLEVLDWGGTGRTLVLLAGLGNDAHVFDKFATALTGSYHVYGITRRGFGASSKPAAETGNYAADRLADDVLAVMQALKLNRPVLVGHSVAGEELSSIGARYPDRVAGLVYLDAGYGYAFYNAARGDIVVDHNDLQRKLDALISPGGPNERLVNELLEQTLPQFEKDLRNLQKQLATNPPPPSPPPRTPEQQIALAVMLGAQKYGGVKCPVLAIYAVPHDFGPPPKEHPEKFEARKAEDLERTSAQADAFAAGNPQARVVRLANANHFVFRSNEEDVLREMKAFIATLPE
jgi:non-heme chloroperoxidase